MLTRQLFFSFFAISLTFFFTSTAFAETDVLLQTDIEGRNNLKRNRLIFTNTMSDGKTALLVLSCQVEDPASFGVVLDFDSEKMRNTEGEEVLITIDGNPPFSQHLLRVQKYLTIAGNPAKKLVKQIFKGKNVSFQTEGISDISFDFSNFSDHITQYTSLCKIP